MPSEVHPVKEHAMTTWAIVREDFRGRGIGERKPDEVDGWTYKNEADGRLTLAPIFRYN